MGADLVFLPATLAEDRTYGQRPKHPSLPALRR
jgi:hypothetical protein